MRSLITVMCLLMLTACGANSLQDLKASSYHRTTIVDGNYQDVFRCYTPYMYGGRGHIYTERKVAEHVYATNGTWYGVAQFTQVTPNSTKIEMWHKIESIIDRDYAWAVGCAQKS
ncbi:hypothetical protein [Thalassospira marina]|uniref:Uncharacterized protein n=1 Tax=Thalassospira marina TaxID=2048283 RepID=A0ABN5FH58_9PROT|nr:hypothetical protein [Thalassospira marina]AUG53945.1 hypothetical protein CSC3H3_15375 [Thalassospira marina]